MNKIQKLFKLKWPEIILLNFMFYSNYKDALIITIFHIANSLLLSNKEIKPKTKSNKKKLNKPSKILNIVCNTCLYFVFLYYAMTKNFFCLLSCFLSFLLANSACFKEREPYESFFLSQSLMHYLCLIINSSDNIQVSKILVPSLILFLFFGHYFGKLLSIMLFNLFYVVFILTICVLEYGYILHILENEFTIVCSVIFTIVLFSALAVYGIRYNKFKKIIIRKIFHILGFLIFSFLSIYKVPNSYLKLIHEINE
jgi:hypothetical protein